VGVSVFCITSCSVLFNVCEVLQTVITTCYSLLCIQFPCQWSCARAGLPRSRSARHNCYGLFEPCRSGAACDVLQAALSIWMCTQSTNMTENCFFVSWQHKILSQSAQVYYATCNLPILPCTQLLSSWKPPLKFTWGQVQLQVSAVTVLRQFAWAYQTRLANWRSVWRHGRCLLALWTKQPLKELRRTSISPSSSWKQDSHLQMSLQSLKYCRTSIRDGSDCEAVTAVQRTAWLVSEMSRSFQIWDSFLNLMLHVSQSCLYQDHNAL
jgi:hypothetical protein